MYNRIFNEIDEDNFITPYLESTFNISKDVDYVYNNCGFKEFVEDIKNKVISNEIKKAIVEQDNFIFKKINSIELLSKDSKKANVVNSIDLYCGIFPWVTSMYQTIAKDQDHAVLIAISYRSIKYMVENDFNISKLKISDQKSILSDLSKEKIKSNIAHELSHWLSDTLHNYHLTKLVDLSNELNDDDVRLLKQKNINMTYFEIDAQIHGIKNLKKELKKDWDTMSLTDIMFVYTNLRLIALDIYKYHKIEGLKIWKKYLIKRMARENLLGKKMQDTLDIEFLKEKFNNKYDFRIKK